MTELVLLSVQFREAQGTSAPVGYLEFEFYAVGTRVEAKFTVTVATKGDLGSAEKSARGFAMRLIRSLASETPVPDEAETE